ncbi:MAG: nucleotide sugar dehydrogenase [Phycisphaeraceae bacterium]|nr:nucleotide sugar dehydrogenase [Phycisphaeraceae bacterium]
MNELLAKIASKTATVAVVGLGYVGLPTVRAFHDAGFRVIGFDIDQTKIDKLRRGEAYLKHLGTDWVRALAGSSRFQPTSAPADLAAADAIILCVPTPLGEHREPDLSFVEKSTEMVASTLRRGQLIILTSTSYPGTTRGVCKPILDRRGLACGTDYFLAFSPEREDPGRPGVQTRTIPRLVGGVDEPSARVAEALLAAAVERVIPVDSAEIAESAKLLENIYRAVNIALVNELKPVLAAMGIDIWKVIDAAATKPFGFQPFYPGPGLGGHCIPIDPFYLTWRAREFGHVTRFIELAGEINSRMPHQVVDAVARALDESGKTVKGASVLVIGLAYKPDIDDIRESPAAEIITLLAGMGARIAYHDPHIPRFPRMRKYQHDLCSVDLTQQNIAAADCVVIVTNHSGVDYVLLGEHARLIVDTRNAMSAVKNPRARIVRA